MNEKKAAKAKRKWRTKMARYLDSVWSPPWREGTENFSRNWVQVSGEKGREKRGREKSR